MTAEEKKETIRKLIKPIIEDNGFELFDLELYGRGRKYSIRIFIDREDGVSLDDCADVSREISTILDVEDIIPSSYVLEVSSHSLDRPIRNPQEFERFKGREARVVTREPIGKQTFFKGLIGSSDKISVELILEKDRHVIIPFNIITRARLEIEF